jgi:hypothetical protein
MLSIRLISYLALFIIVWLLWRMLSNRESSFFKLREAERLRQAFERGELRRRNEKKLKDDLGEAKFEVRKTPLLSGFNPTGAPHELLGISENASEKEIQLAFREKMKLYHPDRIGPQGSREWNDAQEIAVALGAAKDSMIKKYKNKK